MKIMDNTAKIFRSVPFGTLKAGDTFRRTDATNVGYAYMKIEPIVCANDNDVYTAIDLDDGGIMPFPDDKLVYPVEGEFVGHLIRTEEETGK